MPAHAVVADGVRFGLRYLVPLDRRRGSAGQTAARIGAAGRRAGGRAFDACDEGRASRNTSGPPVPRADSCSNRRSDPARSRGKRRGRRTRLRRCPGESGRLRRWRCRPSHRRWKASGAGATSRPGSASCRGSTLPAASRGWAGYRRWASAISGASWSREPCRSFSTRAGVAGLRIRGWTGCWHASRRRWSRWRSPTGRRGGSGRWRREGRPPGSRCRLTACREGEKREAAGRRGADGRRNGVRANVDRTGSEKPAKWRGAWEPACPIWIRSHERHTGPRPPTAASRGRTYDSTRPHCHQLGSESALAHPGASTYAILADPKKRLHALRPMAPPPDGIAMCQ